MVVALALAARPTLAQEAPDPARVPVALTLRKTTGLSVLHALTPGTLARGVPGFRLSYASALNPELALETSLLQIGGGAAIVQGASAGVRASRQVGPIRFSPGVELVSGRAILDEGGWYVEDEAGGVDYRPYRRPASTPAVGGGVTVAIEWIHRWGLGVDALLGYWYMASPEPGGALMVGAGLRYGRRDPVWYWRTSGEDAAPPRLVVAAPGPNAEGVRELGAGGLRIVAADRSGIAAVVVDGVPVELTAAPAADAEIPGVSGPAAVATALPPIHYGTHPLHVEVWDGAGNRATGVVQVSAPAAARPPSTVIVTPTADTLVEASHANVTGFAMSGTPGLRVEVNGCPAEVVPEFVFDTAAHAFRLRLPLEPGPNPIEVETTDPIRGRSAVRRDVFAAPAAADSARGTLPALAPWSVRSVSGRALRVGGLVSDSGGIGVREVRVGAVPAALRSRSGTSVDGRFLAYVIHDPVDSIEILAATFDGRISSVSVPPPVPRRGQPAAAALLIGVEDYAADHITGPTGAAASAAAMADLLREHAAVEVRPDRARVLVESEATEDEIRAAMRWLAATAPEVDVVYVYLAGRAVRGAAGEARGLVPHDALATYGPGSIGWVELDRLFRTMPAEVVVLAELSDGGGRALPPPIDAACGIGRPPVAGLAVLAATGAADGSFSRRALETLTGAARADGTPVLLADLIRELGSDGGVGPVLRTRGPVFDPALPLTTVRRED